MNSTKWKIQTALYCGWADIKTSFDGGPYVDDHYDTREEALSQMADFIHGEEDGTGYRVVEASVPQDDDLYE
jgi:hypothetical protein